MNFPQRIGPVELSLFGGWIAVRCPSYYVPPMRKAGALWEPASRRWW